MEVKKVTSKCQCVIIPQTVKKRVYEVNIDKLQNLLRTQKKNLGLTNRYIATELNLPITQVEHYFRTDNCFAIPEPNVWGSLTKMLNIYDSDLDKQITSFIEQNGVFEKSERHYLPNGLSPTITSTDNIRILEI